MQFGPSSPQVTSTTTTPTMSPEQQQLLGLVMPTFQQYAASPPKRYGGNTVAGFDPAQLAGQEALLGAVRGQQGAVNNAQRVQDYWTSGDIWKPENNSGLRGAIDASVRPITQQLTEATLPALRSGAAGNAYGSSRQGIAEGLASGRASQAAGDTAAKLAESEYGTNVGAQMQAAGMTPMLQQAALQPGLTMSGVGGERQAMQQALINQMVGNWNYDQNAPYLQARDVFGLLSSLPSGATSVSTGAPPAQLNPLMRALGTGASGASIGSMFGPWGTAAGAGIGGLYGLLSR